MPEPVEWKCDACGFPVDNGTGYLHISHADVRRAEEAARYWGERNTHATGAAPSTRTPNLGPDDARGQVHHSACDPNPDPDDYSFEVARARTFADLLLWTLHLQDKAWLGRVTDWDTFVKIAAQRAGAIDINP